MPYTMKQLTKRYGQIVAKLDKTAPAAAERAEIEKRIAALDRTINTAEKNLEKLDATHWRTLLAAAERVLPAIKGQVRIPAAEYQRLAQAVEASAVMAAAEDAVSAFFDERHELKRRLGQRRVRLVSGKRGTADGIVVGEGDSQAEALANAGQRVGRG